MVSKDHKTKVAPVLLLEPANLASTDTASGILDTLGFESAEIQVIVSALTGVDGSNYLTPVLQESDTTAATDFAAVDAAYIIGGFSKVDATTKDSVIQRAAYKGTKRYLRVNLDYTGTGISAGVVGVIGLLGDARDEPAVAPSVPSTT